MTAIERNCQKYIYDLSSHPLSSYLLRESDCYKPIPIPLVNKGTRPLYETILNTSTCGQSGEKKLKHLILLNDSGI